MLRRPIFPKSHNVEHKAKNCTERTAGETSLAKTVRFKRQGYELPLEAIALCSHGL